MDISIVITTYNYQNFLEHCIDSCLNQKPSHVTYEVIVVDDGSTDGTSKLVKKYTADSLRYFRIRNSGVEIASNFGFKKCRGNFVVRVDADDFLHDEYICNMSQYLDNDFDFFYSDYHTVDIKNRIVKKEVLPKYNENEIFKRGDFLATGTMFRSSLIRSLGGYKTVPKKWWLGELRICFAMHQVWL